MSEQPLSTVSGRVDVTALAREGRRQTVRVYLPPDYETSARDYSVIYMFDGHNLFDAATSRYQKEWGIDETMEGLYLRDPGRTAVVVGIDAPWGARDRYAEYTIADWIAHAEPGDTSTDAERQVQGVGERTASFLIEEVKPWAERSFRVSADRRRVAVAGSSLGGYMSLYTAARFSDQVSAALAFSPVALDRPMAGHVLRAYLAATPPVAPQRYYLDMGDAEDLNYTTREALVANLEPLEEALRASGHDDIWSRVIAGGAHDEEAWGRRFEEVLTWWSAGWE